jgi:glycosyltransferase involved in cell wall biosynthesis
MFGDDHGLGQEAELWARKNGLTENVDFVGMVPYATLMQTLATEVDVLVHPAFVEAHSMAVSEALAVGLPVIAGKSTGGMAHLLEQGRLGFLVDVASDAAVSDAMLKLALDDDLRARLGEAARASAQIRFAPDTITRAYEQEYARVLENWPSGTGAISVAASGA